MACGVNALVMRVICATPDQNALKRIVGSRSATQGDIPCFQLIALGLSRVSPRVDEAHARVAGTREQTWSVSPGGSEPSAPYARLADGLVTMSGRPIFR